MGQRAPVTRRRFQHLGLVLLPAVYVGAFVAAALRFLAPLPGGRKLTRFDVGEVADFPPGAPPRRIEWPYDRYTQRIVFVFHDGDGLRALDAKCTHLGCKVVWSGSSKEAFQCQCHGAAFDLDGEAIAGPTDVPLKEYAVADPETTGGRVVVLDRLKATG